MVLLFALACVQRLDFRTLPCDEAVVDPRGGELAVATPSGGARLVVPAGALGAPTSIALCRVGDPPADGLSPVWEVRPVGLRLAAPAALSLDHTGDDDRAALLVPGGADPLRTGTTASAGRITGPMVRFGAARVVDDGRLVVPYRPSTTADVLLAVDGSASMADDLAALGAAVGDLRPALDASGSDYHLGVVAINAQGPHTGELQTRQEARWFDAGSPDALLGELLELPSDLGKEQGLGAAWMALEVHADGYNAGFLRDTGPLHVVVVSDEPDQTAPALIEPQGLAAWLLARSPEPARLHAVVDPELGDPYLEVAAATGGRVADIRDPSWADLLADVVADLEVGMRLDPPALPATVEVWRELQGGRPERLAPHRFAYDPVTGRLEVFGTDPDGALLWVVYVAEPG